MPCSSCDSYKNNEIAYAIQNSYKKTNNIVKKYRLKTSRSIQSQKPQSQKPQSQKPQSQKPQSQKPQSQKPKYTLFKKKSRCIFPLGGMRR